MTRSARLQNSWNSRAFASLALAFCFLLAGGSAWAQAGGTGGNFQIVTKGGSNELHGSAYWFVQNEVFNANGSLSPVGVTRGSFAPFGLVVFPALCNESVVIRLGGSIWRAVI